MKERPILFSPEMARAIREGRKTETRRVVNVGRLKPSVWTHDGIGSWGPRDAFRWVARALRYNVWSWPIRCPYGDPGDRLWVREQWAVHFRYDGRSVSSLQLSCKGEVAYRADGMQGGWIGKWRPSIHMPRWACRTVLEVVERFPQQLQEIDEESAKSEGVEFRGGYWLGGIHRIKGTLQCWPTARDAFARIWDRINAKRGYPWESNPWVWVVRFKVVEGA